MSFKPYPKYKESGVEWLGRVPEHWEVARLKYVVAQLSTGGTPDTTTTRFWAEGDEGGVPWVSIGDMSREPVVRTTEKRLTSEGIASKRLDVLPTGTLLFSMFASLGKVASLGVPAAINQAILGITPNDCHVSGAFLRYWLTFLQSHVDQFSSSNTQDNLNAGKVRNFPIVVASLSEQSRITSFLDHETAKIDALIAEQQRLIELLQEKRQAVISRAVTKGLNPDAPMKDSGIEWLGEVPEHWEVRRLKNVTPSVTVGIVVEPSKYYVPEGVPALRSLNVSARGIDLENVVFISREANLLHGKSCLRAGDIVAVRSGQPGTCAIIPQALDGCNCVDLIIIRKPIACTEHFLRWYLLSDSARMQFGLGVEGAIQQHFNVSTAVRLIVTVPPAVEQRLIVEAVDRATAESDELANDAMKGITLLQERRSALISAAVTGQIDVRGFAGGTEAA